MLESSPQELNGESKDEERLASCFNCKRSKVKCVRSRGSSTCARCTQRRLECRAPLFHVGRHKGVKNKHSGLEKAVFQLEQALKRTQPGSDQIQHREQSVELRNLLERSRHLLSAEQSQTHHHAIPGPAVNGLRHEGSVSSPRHSSLTSHETPPSQADSCSRDGGPLSESVEDDQLNLDDAENPLQLLARTSELLSSIDNSDRGPSGDYLPFKPPRNRDGEHDGNSAVFFSRYQPRLDLGPELDPVELGLLTLSEAESLFLYFYNNLAHTRWGIDPVLHTVDFVRRRSAFLFTSIVAASALFSPSLETLHRRLSRHRQKLADLVMTKRYKSVEIVLAFMVNVPWIPAGQHWADDETSTYMSMALSIAMDLYLNKVILPSSSDTSFPRDNIPSSDQISARRALSVDGFGDLDPMCEMGRRLLRRRERTWLSLFVLERGVCLARGRSYMLPISQLIENCDQWHLNELADRWDGSIVSVAVLRRDLAKLLATLREICDSYVNGISEATIVDKLKSEITMFFDSWYHTWPLQIGDREQFTLPPYVEILASHTRLSAYASIINYPTAPLKARHFFRSEGLSSALNVLRVAVQGERQLRSMPNNTAIMISFAACFALRVSTVVDGKGSALAPSIRVLIMQTIDVLDRIGSTPVQRRGLSCLFANQLRQILKLASRSAGESVGVGVGVRVPASVSVSVSVPAAVTVANGLEGRGGYPNTNTNNNSTLSTIPRNQAPAATTQRRIPTTTTTRATASMTTTTTSSSTSSIPTTTGGTGGNNNNNNNNNTATTTMPSEYLLFATMSNDQLNEAINNTNVGLDALWENFQFQQASELDWMDWSTFA
ncbi:hypothetical protein GGR50DRAFT_679293 [Xylaria sp. CBS 124048]|nr:hypothetical protein GGR50DRAFT_679293 [Xylaria sp. CBS 124048]